MWLKSDWSASKAAEKKEDPLRTFWDKEKEI